MMLNIDKWLIGGSNVCIPVQNNIHHQSLSNNQRFLDALPSIVPTIAVHNHIERARSKIIIDFAWYCITGDITFVEDYRYELGQAANSFNYHPTS